MEEKVHAYNYRSPQTFQGKTICGIDGKIYNPSMSIEYYLNKGCDVTAVEAKKDWRPITCVECLSSIHETRLKDVMLINDRLKELKDAWII